MQAFSRFTCLRLTKRPVVNAIRPPTPHRSEATNAERLETVFFSSVFINSFFLEDSYHISQGIQNIDAALLVNGHIEALGLAFFGRFADT